MAYGNGANFVIADGPIEVGQRGSAVHNLKPRILEKGEAIGGVHAEMDNHAAHGRSPLPGLLIDAERNHNREKLKRQERTDESADGKTRFCVMPVHPKGSRRMDGEREKWELNPGKKVQIGERTILCGSALQGERQ